jgi:hypothetical protein
MIAGAGRQEGEGAVAASGRFKALLQEASIQNTARGGEGGVVAAFKQKAV